MAETRKYFGTDGIRGEVGWHPITADFFLKLGWAAGTGCSPEGNGGRRVVIGKDTRISGYMFESVLEAGLTAAGVDVVLLGPMPTPAVAYLHPNPARDGGYRHQRIPQPLHRQRHQVLLRRARRQGVRRGGTRNRSRHHRFAHADGRQHRYRSGGRGSTMQRGATSNSARARCRPACLCAGTPDCGRLRTRSHVPHRAERLFGARRGSRLGRMCAERA